MSGMKERGFTLVELVVVAALVGILATAATAMIDVSPDRQAGIAAEALRGDLLYARALAIRTGEAVTVCFTAGSPFYQMQSGGAAVLDPRTGRPYVVDVRGTARSPSAVIASPNFGGAAQLVFGPDGAPPAAGQVVVSVNGAGYVAAIAPVTGLVTVVRQ